MISSYAAAGWNFDTAEWTRVASFQISGGYSKRSNSPTKDQDKSATDSPETFGGDNEYDD